MFGRRRRPPATAISPPQGLIWTPEQTALIDLLTGGSSVYLWGPPGTGKTTLLDAVARSAPSVTRGHLSAFLSDLHVELHRSGRGVEPAIVALTGRARVMCLDEVHLNDVADAVYLRTAIDWWLLHGVRVVATSNYPPEALLPDPRLHGAAEPVIARLREAFVIREIAGADHRVPGGRGVTGFASGSWTTGPEPGDPKEVAESILVVNGRDVRASTRGNRLDVTFDELCVRPRSVSDYLDLATRFRHVVVHGVPSPDELGREPAQRMVLLVDVACDLDLRLCLRGPGTPDDLRRCPEPPHDVDRTVSRLSLLSRSEGPQDGA